MTSEFLDYLLLLLNQFAGGPSAQENNLVQFGLPAAFWGVLLAIAWSRQRQHHAPREKWLVWGFGLGFTRESYMFFRTSVRIITATEHDVMCSFSEPLEHALEMVALVVIAGAFIRYLLNDSTLTYRYLKLGLGATALCYLVTFWGWARLLAANPAVRFHQTWYAWPFHIVAPVLMAIAIALMLRRKGWLRNIVALALLLFLSSELTVLFNYATDRAYRHVICPVGNSLHILAIPLLGYVYFREQSIARQRVEQELRVYRHHLEESVRKRTAELTTTNTQLQKAIIERIQAEVALEKLGRQNELILDAAGEGIFGVDVEGHHTFVNPAAAAMLGYSAEELIGRPGHATWHHSGPDGSAYLEEECPLCTGYRLGNICLGDDQFFWRQDGSCFPVEYISTPVRERGELTGAVVVFRDITQRKQVEREIAQRNAELAGQNAIAATISQSLDLDTILHTALDKVLDVLQMDAGRVFLLEPDEKTMRLRAQQATEPVSEESDLRLPLSEGISGMAMTENRPVVLNAAELGPDRLADFLIDDMQTFVSTPLVSKGWVIGALTLGSRRSHAIPRQVLSLLASIGQQIGMAVENAHLYRQTERWANGMAQLHQASLVLSSSLDMATIYDQITEQGAKLLNCEVANLFLWDQEEGVARVFSSYGGNGAEFGDLRLLPQQGRLLTELITHRRPIAIRNYATDPRAVPLLREMFHIEAQLALPLQVHERLLGFLFLVDQKGPRFWRSEEIDWAESLVSHASIALENALLYERAERAAALEERHRIAAEIHDGLAQTLGYLGLRADQVIDMVAVGNQRETLQELQHMRDVIGQASQEARRSIANLQESSSTNRPLQHWLDEIVAEFSENGDHEMALVNHFEAPLLLPPADLEQVLRVVQEALLNAFRHASADRITICLDERDGNAVVSIQDDGQGFDPQAPAADGRMRFGLSIMRARAARLRGHVKIETSPGKGTQVVLSWPLSASSFTMSMSR